MNRLLTGVLAAAMALASMGWATVAAACDGAGVIIRIDGRPQDVVIMRTTGGTTAAVTRPRVLEVVCHNDVVKTLGATFVVLSIDGSGPVRVDHNVTLNYGLRYEYFAPYTEKNNRLVNLDHNADYTVPGGRGAPSIVGNAYRTLSDQVMPDMKRLPWNVRIKGGGDEFGFALPGLTAGGQQVRAGSRVLLIRLVGGVAPYKVEIRNAQNAIVAATTSSSHEVLVPAVALARGAYRITASDATPLALEATIVAVDQAPPADAAYADLTDPEVRTAVMATALARSAPASWSFEAEQQLQAAPANGLDRDKVYELIENYSSE